MKQPLFFAILLLFKQLVKYIIFYFLLSAFYLLPLSVFAQNRFIARGAEQGELYLSSRWYAIYNPIWGPPSYDTLRMAVYHITKNGKKITIQYNVDCLSNPHAPPDSIMHPQHILADATPGITYNKQTYSKNNYTHTALWVSFDYGKNWIFREEGIGSKGYYAANMEGVIFRHGTDGAYKSEDYGSNFNKIEIVASGSEPGLQYGEAFSIGSNNPYQGRLGHTYNFYETYSEIPIDSQFVFGSLQGLSPDVYRGGLPDEVYISSWFPGWIYKASFSADLGQDLCYVFIYEDYSPYATTEDPPFFMSDREAGVFYIIRRYEVEDTNNWGWYRKVCIEYYRDYGETHVATYCHDLTKDYGTICEAVNSLASEKHYHNNILLTWSEPESSLPVEIYNIYRNNEFIAATPNTTCLDENLPVGNYEYYVITNYTTDCVSDMSNITTITVDESYKITFDVRGNENIPISEATILINDEELTTDEQGIAVISLFNGVYPYIVSKTGYVEIDTVLTVCDELQTIVINMEYLNINENIFLNAVIYPNPTTGELRIDNRELRIENVEMFDVYGRKLISDIRYPISEIGQSEIIINISNLQMGIYFLRISTEKGTTTKKIIKI